MHKKVSTKQTHARAMFKKAVKYAQKMIKEGNHKTIADGVKEYYHKHKHQKHDK